MDLIGIIDHNKSLFIQEGMSFLHSQGRIQRHNITVGKDTSMESLTGWLWLLAAILIATFGNYIGKAGTGLFGSIIFYTAFLLSLFAYKNSLITLPLGIAYVFWAAFGSFPAVIMGVLFFNESINLLKSILISDIVISAMIITLM